MKIYDGSLSNTSAAESGRTADIQRPDRESGVRSGSTSSAHGDRVELSSTLNSLSRALSTFSSNRSARVSALAAQYQSGKYQVDAMATSRGMVAESLAAGSK